MGYQRDCSCIAIILANKKSERRGCLKMNKRFLILNEVLKLHLSEHFIKKYTRCLTYMNPEAMM